MRRAVFPGTFDPFTIGHYDVVQRGLELFDEIVVAIGVNINKKTVLDADQRINLVQQVFRDEPRIRVESYNKLTVDFALEKEARFILRGIRTVADFEYEQTIANANRALSGVETVIIFTDPKYSFVSSSVVRDLISFGKDVTKFLPPGVDKLIQ